MSLPLISDCVIWLDASDTTTLSSFSALDVDATNNRNHTDLLDQDQIGFWGNKISDQYHFTNSWGVTGNRPFYVPSLSAINFTSQDQTYLTANYGAIIGPQTVFVLTMARDSIQGYRIFTQAVLNRNDEQDVIPLIQGDYNGGIASVRPTNYFALANTTRAKGKFFVACYNNTGTQIQNSIDSNSPVTFNTTIGNLNINRMRLGARLLSNGLTTGSESNYDGLIREVIVYNKSLTVAERSSVVGYLTGKWDLEQHQENAIYALESGNWDSILWSTSGLPNPEKDTVYSNGFTVFINNSLSANIITNRFGNGTFRLSGEVTLSAGLILCGGASNRCVDFNLPIGREATIISTLCAETFHARGISNSSSGTLNYFGHIIPGRRIIGGGGDGVISNSGTMNISGSITASFTTAGNPWGASNSGTMNVVGEVYVGGGTSGIQSHGIVNSGRLSIRGLASGGFAGSNPASSGVRNSGVLSLTGIVGGGNNINSPGITHSANNTCMITGIVSGGSSGSASNGVVLNANFGEVFVEGNVYGGSGSSAHGIRLNSTGTIRINGDVYGGSGSDTPGVSNNSQGVVIINGAAYGGIGSGQPGVKNNNLGSISVVKAVGNEWGRGSVGVGGPSAGVESNNLFGQVTVQELQIGPRGQWPTTGNVYIDHVENSELSARGEYYYPTTTAFDTKTDSASGLLFFTTKLGGTSFVPAVSNVRLGVVYDLESKTGTLVLPIPQVVLNTEPLDDGFGAANFDTDLVWQVKLDEIRPLPPNTIGKRLLQSISIEKTGEIRTQMR